MNGQDNGGWLPIALCPTDGVWRLVKMPDGSEVIAAFDGLGLLAKNRWQTKTFAYHNPSRPSPVAERGGVVPMTAPYDSFIIANMKEGIYPTHFRPNDTVFGNPKDSGKAAPATPIERRTPGRILEPLAGNLLTASARVAEMGNPTRTPGTVEVCELCGSKIATEDCGSMQPFQCPLYRPGRETL